MGFENSVGVALGGSMCGTLVGEHFMMYKQRCNLFGARLHACSTRKNQRAWWNGGL